MTIVDSMAYTDVLSGYASQFQMRTREERCALGGIPKADQIVYHRAEVSACQASFVAMTLFAILRLGGCTFRCTDCLEHLGWGLDANVREVYQDYDCAPRHSRSSPSDLE